MSLKEALERDQVQQAASAKADDFYQRMFEEAGIPSEKVRLRGGGAKLYKDSLPIKLPPEHQALIDEFVELCPPKAWKKAPDKVNREYASAVWTGYPSTYLKAEYGLGWHEVYIGQIKLSDGSVHVYSEPLRLTLNVGSKDKLVRPFLISSFFSSYSADEKALSFGIEKVLQEMQTKLDHLHRHKYGTGEYVCLPYDGCYEYGRQGNVHIFRDKNLYDLGDRRGAPYQRNKKDFERLLLSELKKYSK